mgnify:CR=1 FL=1
MRQKRQIGIVQQNVAVFDEFTVYEKLMIAVIFCWPCI